MFASAISLLFAQVGEPQLQHGGNVFWHEHGWTIYSYLEEKSCDLTANFENGESITLEYAANRPEAMLVITNRHATSLRHDQEVLLNVVFLAKGRPSKVVPNVRFTAKANETAGRILAAPGLGREFVDDFGRFELLAVMNGKNLVGGAPLEGTGRATANLIRCSQEAGGIDPQDPFQN